MAFSNLSPDDLLRLWRDQLMPRVQNETPGVVLAGPPGASNGGLRAWRRDTSPLPEPRDAPTLFVMHAWPDAGVHSIRFPLLLHVLEGEADFRIGGTREQIEENGANADCGCHSVALAEGTFFLIPPGLPFSDGSHPHWDRKNLTKAHSRLLWIHVLPTGLSFHLCQTSGAKHELTSSLLLKDARLMPLIEHLIWELRAPTIDTETVSSALLAAFLRRIEHRLTQKSCWLAEGDVERLAPAGFVRKTDGGVGALAVQQACAYIHRYLQSELSPLSIAQQAHVSVSHLNRLFRAELGVSIMEFVMQARVEAAQALLQTTDLPVGDISRLVGFARPAHLTQVFTRLTQTSPLAFRRAERLSR